MKSSALALATAAALMFGATSVSFAQETTTRPASEAECAELAAEGADVPAVETDDDESTETNGSLSAQSDEDGSTKTSDSQSDQADEDDTDESDEGDAIDDQTPPDCPVVAQ